MDVHMNGRRCNCQVYHMINLVTAFAIARCLKADHLTRSLMEYVRLFEFVWGPQLGSWRWRKLCCTAHHYTMSTFHRSNCTCTFEFLSLWQRIGQKNSSCAKECRGAASLDILFRAWKRQPNLKGYAATPCYAQLTPCPVVFWNFLEHVRRTSEKVTTPRPDTSTCHCNAANPCGPCQVYRKAPMGVSLANWILARYGQVALGEWVVHCTCQSCKYYDYDVLSCADPPLMTGQSSSTWPGLSAWCQAFSWGSYLVIRSWSQTWLSIAWA